MRDKLDKVDIESFKVKRLGKELYVHKKDVRVQQMYDRLLMVAMSVFEWVGLPIGINPMFLERTLLTHGSVLFFDLFKETEKSNHPVVMKYMASFKYDYYGDPLVRRAYAENLNNPFRETLTHENSVIIYDNILKTTFSAIILDFAEHLVDIKSVIETNINHQKRPYIVGAVEGMEKSLQELFEQANDGKPYLILKDKFASKISESMQVFGVNSEFIANELQDYYDAVWNEFMVMVGVGTNASPKRERLVAEEVTSVNQQSEIFAETRLKTRERACELINEMFGLNVSVKYKFGGEDNGTVHNNNTEHSEKSVVG